jgi:hypothetical protein
MIENNDYSNSEVYLINWLGGTSGAFITGLLDQFVNEPISSEEIVFSDSGHAHDFTDNRLKNTMIDSAWEVRENSNDIPVYMMCRPIDSTKPLILVDHNIPVYEDLFQIFPKCKVIIITRSKQMLPRLKGNMFFKNTCEGFPGNKEYWDSIRELHDSVSIYQDPNEVPIEVAEEFIKSISEQWPDNNGLFFNEDFIDPNQYKDNIFRISFYDIIHNSNSVLQQLSVITNKPISPELELFYEKYLETQDNLIKTKMPWLDDK